MSSYKFALLSAFIAAATTQVVAQEATGTFPPVPLASKTFEYPGGIPYKVDTDVGLIRGTQKGYNICNSTTENQDSLCQTSFVNSIDDFCLWAPSEPESVVANTEGEMVAWCTKPGHGSRLIPEGALQGVQFIQTPDYISLVGFVDQRLINIQSDDYGGEMDPHGADLRGNPMGGIMFSSAFGTPNKQVIEWHKCPATPAGPNAAHFCEHVFDRIGCAYNVPNNAKNGTFESCKGENQDFPGVYTDEAGAVQTYTQPPESLGAIPPSYLDRSAKIYTGLPSPTGAAANPSGSGLSSVRPSGSGKPSASGSRSATSGKPTAGSSTTEEGSALRGGVSLGMVLVGLVGGFVLGL
ncbi:manno protein [Coprinopsis sp. MPI-PUGE-AT-0042]|nr:manno protein [Coprinopsis sp. MPI-PUGE-AT-0042]